MTPDHTPRQRGWTFSLRTMFVAVTVFGVWLGIALSAKEFQDGIAFAISSAVLSATLWLAEPVGRRSLPAAWRLLGWAVIGIGSMAILFKLWPSAG